MLYSKKNAKKLKKIENSTKKSGKNQFKFLQSKKIFFWTILQLSKKTKT